MAGDAKEVESGQHIQHLFVKTQIFKTGFKPDHNYRPQSLSFQSWLFCRNSHVNGKVYPKYCDTKQMYIISNFVNLPKEVKRRRWCKDKKKFIQKIEIQ